MKYLAGFVGMIALVTSNANAQERVELAPFSNWVMNYDDDSCALQRQFGEEGQQAYLELRQFGRQQDMQVIVASEDFKRRNGPFRFAVEPSGLEPWPVRGFDMRLGDDYEGKLFSYTPVWADPRTLNAYRQFAATSPLVTDGQRTAVLQSLDLDREGREFARLIETADYEEGARLIGAAFLLSDEWREVRDAIEAEADGVFLDGAFDRPLFLRTGELHAPMEAMRKCIDELYSHWGIDAEAHKTLTRPAIPLDYQKLVREVQEDYPNRMLMNRMQGYVRVRLDISPQGEPTGCHVQVPINDEAFEKEACENMLKHGKFSPALDSAGQPIASVYQTSIIYVLNR